ncbi:MAG TPA: molybdate ABC transporter substrate-binding protein [Acidobacteriota bacterium]|nr:molybdate ABC transporter substrate-binding protein [Acidobacteriota bacterium]
MRSGLTKSRAWLLLLSLSSAPFAGCTGSGQEDEVVVVYAAASLRDVMHSLSEPFQRSSGTGTVFNFAGSNVLARQIDATPAADVYLSANEQWVDFLQERGRIVAETRRTFASNRLVIVAHRNSPFQLQEAARLADLDFRYLSLADPEAVPAGRYARQYLQSIEPDGRLWKRLQERVAPAPDVRAALALVEADPRILGIVYATDAASSQKVRVLYEVPRAKGPDIRYSAALVKGGPNPAQGRRFLEFLSGPEARRVLEEMGFGFGVAE